MKYVYIRSLITIIAILIMVVGPLECVKKAKDYENSMYNSKISYDILDYGNDDIFEKANHVKELSDLEVDYYMYAKKAKQYKYVGTTIFIVIGLIILITRDKIMNFIMRDKSHKIKKMNSINKYDELKKLQDLKEVGTLTEEEFEREKNKILQ